MTRVSIIIPCYNSGNLLNDAVSSAFAQNHSDLEVIVVDDGSTDDSTLQSIDQSVAAGAILVRQPNRGLPAARNAGIKASTGEFILPLDADDLIHEAYASEAAAVLDDTTETGIVYCSAELFGDETGRWETGHYSIGTMLNGNVIFATAMFRKSDWERVGGFPEDLKIYEDYAFWLRLISIERRVVKLPGVRFYYRRHHGQMTGEMDRAEISAALAWIFKDNVSLYLRYATEYMEVRQERFSYLQHMKNRYSLLEEASRRLSYIKRLTLR